MAFFFSFLHRAANREPKPQIIYISSFYIEFRKTLTLNLSFSCLSAAQIIRYLYTNMRDFFFFRNYYLNLLTVSIVHFCNFNQVNKSYTVREHKKKSYLKGTRPLRQAGWWNPCTLFCETCTYPIRTFLFKCFLTKTKKVEKKTNILQIHIM